MLRHALQYAERGWYVFPVHSMHGDKCSCGRMCGRPGKHPRTQNGWKDATLSPDTIEKWWRQWPDANIGVACGPSGLLVVDVDPRNNGDETFADLETRHGVLPPTRTALTGGGGQHYFFDVTGVDGKFKGRILGQGVELQASGQYVVVPPSNHASGRVYGWDAGQPTEVAFPPSWMIDEPMRTAKLPEALGSPLDCILGVAFAAAAMHGPPLGPDRILVQCPWEAEHTQGSRFDGSTIVFGPMRGSKWGWFHCSHAHCKERLAAFQGLAKMHEVLRGLPEKAAELAQQRVKGADRELRRVTRAKWEESLVWDPRGERIEPTAGNLQLMFENMQEWSGLVAFDESKDRLFWTKDPPEIFGLQAPKANHEINEHDWVYVSHWFNLTRRTSFKRETAADTLVASGYRNAHNSLTEYVQSVRWDGKERLSTWLEVYLGARGGDLNARVGRAWMVSAMARALSPGCQVDHVLVLEGEQGAGKTSVFRILGGDWYLGGLPRLEDKDARHILSGAWIVELKELASVRGSAIEKVKAYLDEIEDYFRPPYGRNFVKRKRRCVFGASTNDGEYVHDQTGARRFWPVKVGTIDLDSLRRDRDQLWAEAREAYFNDERWWIAKGELVAEALKEEQLTRITADPWSSRIEAYAEFRDELRTDELLTHCGVDYDKRKPHDAMRVGQVLAALGWERRKVLSVEKGKRELVWVKRRG